MLLGLALFFADKKLKDVAVSNIDDVLHEMNLIETGYKTPKVKEKTGSIPHPQRRSLIVTAKKRHKVSFIDFLGKRG